jgi:hypothetical protein
MNKILYAGYRSFSTRANLVLDNYRSGYYIVLDHFGFIFFWLTHHIRLDIYGYLIFTNLFRFGFVWIRSIMSSDHLIS